MINLFDMNFYSMNESNLNYQLVQKLAATGMDVFHRGTKFAVSDNLNIDGRLVSKLKSVMEESQAVMPYDERTVFMVGKYKGSDVFIQFVLEYDNEAVTVDLRVFSHLVVADELVALVQHTFKHEVLPSIQWWYVGPHGETTRNYYLPKDGTTIHPEFYPDLGDPKKYIAEYMRSNESVLLIAGSPGTGKTTLLRHMIHDYKLSAHVIYDERIMEKDGPFQSFLFGKKSTRPGFRFVDDYGEDGDGGDVMIIEDADTLLTARERDGNKLMSRFLNISDGLIKLPNKKLIFTTNIIDFGNVDHALLRPGRCFGLMHTRPLNLNEAQLAAKVANLPIPDEKREYTLAELFNQGKNTKVRTMGFGTRH